MAEDAEHLLRQRMLGNTVEMMEGGLCTPADVESRMHMALRPVKDRAQLVPVGHVLEIEKLDRRTGHDEAVELLVLHPLPVAIEGDHVIGGGVLRRMFGDLD